MTVKYFKAKENTKRFKKGQKVWVVVEYENYLRVLSKWHGSGRYTYSILDKWDWSKNKINWNTIIGEDGLNEMEVQEKFIKKIMFKYN